MNTSPEGKAAIRREEGVREYAYPDPASDLAKAYPRERWGFVPARDILHHLPASAQSLKAEPWTVGIGQTRAVTIDTHMTVEEADRDLDRSLMRYEAIVDSSCTREPTQGQFEALTSLAWNCPAAVEPKSSIIKAHNRGDWQAAAAAFSLYANAKGKPNASLMARRKREAAAYLEASPTDSLMSDLSPQTVDGERPMSRSKINLAQAGTCAIAGVGAINEVLNAVTQLKEGVSSLGTWLVPMACIAVVILCGFTIWQRLDLRKRGIV